MWPVIFYLIMYGLSFISLSYSQRKWPLPTAHSSLSVCHLTALTLSLMLSRSLFFSLSFSHPFILIFLTLSPSLPPLPPLLLSPSSPLSPSVRTELEGCLNRRWTDPIQSRWHSLVSDSKIVKHLWQRTERRSSDSESLLFSYVGGLRLTHWYRLQSRSFNTHSVNNCLSALTSVPFLQYSSAT